MPDALPDVPSDEYRQYQSNQFAQQNQARVDQFSFAQNNMSRIQGLGMPGFEVPEIASSSILGQLPTPTLPQLPAMPQIPALPQLPLGQPAPISPPVPAPTPAPAPPMAPPIGLPSAPEQPTITPAPPIAPPAPTGPQPIPGIAPVPDVSGPPPGVMGVPSIQPITPPAPVFAPTTTPSTTTSLPTTTSSTTSVSFDPTAPAVVAVNQAPPGDLQNYARQAASAAGISADLFAAQIQQESGYNPNAGSSAGAQGIAQIVPQYHPGVNTWDPKASLDYAANLMASLLKQYGGDWAKALIAYNGGGGAVQAWDSGKPYQESQTYVSQILGNSRPNQTGSQPTPQQQVSLGAPRQTAMDQSQFGDAQLTTAEAYAACGPAAAVRFAQAFGRNPTLREAVDLAASPDVGWTAQQGMAGISSEQRLLDKMGIPTKLVGNDPAAIAREAQTGNPVTISTAGHYFYADGYNPQTQQFHVGRSGLDLKNGAEWMTLQQMQNAMGAVQGALFANHPTIDNPSTSQNPLDTLDSIKQAATSVFSGFRTPTTPSRPQSNDPQVQQLDRAVEIAHLPTRPLSDLTDTTSATAGIAQPQQPQQPGVVARSGGLENLGNLIGNAINSALGAAGLVPPGGPKGGSSDQDQTDQQDQNAQPSVQQRAADMIQKLTSNPVTGQQDTLGQVTGLYNRPPQSPQEAADRALADIQRRGIPLPGLGGQLAFLQPGRSLRELNPFSKGPEGSVLEAILSSVPKLLGGAGEAAEDVNPLLSRTDETLRSNLSSSGLARFGIDPRQDIPEALHPVAQAIEDGFRERGFLPSNVPTAEDNGILQQILADGDTSLASGLSRTRGQEALDSLTRQFTDSGVDMGTIEKEMAARKGSPLTDSERVSLLARVDPAGQAQAMLDPAFEPVRAIPNENMPDFYRREALLTTRSINEGMARQAEQQMLEAGIAPSTEQRLSSALDDWNAAQQAHDDALAAAANPRTRDSISLSAAQRRVDESQAQLEAATEAASQANADAARERVVSSPTATTVTHPELRDLTIAENNARLLNQKYTKLYDANPDNPYLNVLGRQVGRAEDRAASLRAAIGERSGARGATIEQRAQTAADRAAAQQPRYNPTPAYSGASVKLRYEQQNLERLQNARARGQQGLADAVAAAGERVKKAQADVTQAQSDLPAAARAQYFAQLNGRLSSGLNGEVQHHEDVLKELSDLEARQSPEVMQKFSAASDSLQNLRKQMLQEKVDHGQIDQAAMDGLLKRYDHWTPTNVTEFQSDDRPGVGLPRGGRLDAGTPGLHTYTPEGTSAVKENHVAAMVREVYSHKAGIKKNDLGSALIKGLGDDSTIMRRISNNVREYVDAGGKDGKLLEPDYTLRGNEMKISAMVDGERQDWVTSNKLLKTALDQITPASGDHHWLQTLAMAPAKLVRETAVQRNPGFVPINLARDAIGYAMRMMTEGGVKQGVASTGIHLGPAALTAALTDPDDPNRGEKIAAALALGMGGRVAIGKNLGLGPSATREYMRSLAENMGGLFTGRNTSESLRELEAAGGAMHGGGGVGGGMTPAQAEEALRKLTRQNVFTVRNAGDLKQLANDAAFGWVKSIGNRFEQVPRTATFNMAKARGSSRLQGMIQGREVTTDFNRGGQFSKELNRYIPFFNVGTQALPQLGRLIKRNPGAALLAGTTLLGAPAAASEAYNYSDPQRAKDYEDVPEYLKRLGIVLMDPGEAPRDAQGNRVPQKHFLPIPNEFMPFVEAGRESFKRLSGKGTPQGAGDLIKSLATELSPINDINQLGGAAQPGVGTAIQLGMNRDLFRGSTIANQYSDTNASNLGHAVAPILENAITSLPGHQLDRIHPSQVDWAIKDMLGGLGQTGLNIVDAATRREARVPGTASELPLVGSLASRFVRGTGGQELENARAEILTSSAARALRDAGIEWQPSQVSGTIGKLPLLQAEQAHLQELTNRYIDDAIQRSVRTPTWQNGNAGTKQRLLTYTTGIARQRAQQEVLRSIPASDRIARAQTARQQVAAKMA